MSRASLLLAGAAAVFPIAVLAAQQPPAAMVSSAFAPPTGRMVLTRAIHRGLADGKLLTARRRYVVSIVPEGTGFRVDGELLDCVVDAPPGLRALALLEQQRREEGLFPLRLDAAGQIVEQPPGNASNATDAAMKIAKQRLATSVLSGAERSQAQGFVSGLAEQGARSEWPRDLFHPAPGTRSESRRVALPDGGEGVVTVSTEARAPGGLLDRIERVVVTELGGTRRETREEWSLTAEHS